VLAATRGMAYLYALRGEPDQALEIVRAMRRVRLQAGSYEALVLGMLEGQMLLRRAAVRQGRRTLYEAFYGFLRLGKGEEALQAGLALLLSDSRCGAHLAEQILGFVPASWPAVREALAETIATDHLPVERRSIVHGYLSASGARYGT